MADISSITLPNKSNYGIKAKKIFYAECSTARNVAAKVVSCDGFVLETGAVIAVRFTNTGSANPSSGNITLNINGTSAKNIVPKDSNSIYNYSAGGYFYNNQTLIFVYNGTYFVHLNRDVNTDTKVTSVGNHYTPAKSTTKSASGGTLTDITNSSSGTQVVTGVEMDAKGHVTGVTSVALKSTDTKITVDTALSSTSTNPVQNKAVNAAIDDCLNNISSCYTVAGKAFREVSWAITGYDYSYPDPNVNRTEYSSTLDLTFRCDDVNKTETLPTIYDRFNVYGLADASRSGLMSAEHFNFLEKHKKIRNSSASYTFTSMQDYITVNNCYGNCNNGLVVLSGWFTSTGSAGNPAIISGSFPSAASSFVCGIIVNMDSPNTNTRLLVRHESDGTSSLQCGGSITAGKYFFIGVYTAERCAHNLPYTL